VISPLRRLWWALRSPSRRAPATEPAQDDERGGEDRPGGGDPDGRGEAEGDSDAERRIEAARRRLKATIPPRAEDD